MLSFCCLAFFISTLMNPFSISCKAGIVGMNSLSFCLFWNVFSSPSFLKKRFAKYSILVGKVFCFFFFPIQHFVRISSDSFWSARFLLRNPLSLIEVHLCGTNRFSLALKILCLWHWQFNYNVSYMDFFVFIFFGIHWLLESRCLFSSPDLGSLGQLIFK